MLYLEYCLLHACLCLYHVWMLILNMENDIDLTTPPTPIPELSGSFKRHFCKIRSDKFYLWSIY